jgi:DNA-directed RNA polymerase specialized sigma24 family protein
VEEKEFKKIKNFVWRKLTPGYREKYFDDCVQWVCMKYIENPKRGWHHLIIDFLRAQGETLNRATQKSKVLTYAISEEFLPGEKTPVIGLDLDNIKLDKYDRAILILIFLYELEMEEVGYLFGVTGSRISQRVRYLKYKLTRHFK